MLRDIFQKNEARFVAGVKQKFAAKIRTSSEYRSLVSPQGALHLDFGLGELGGDWEGIADAVTALREIVDLVIDGVKVTINDRKTGDDFVIGIKITLLENIDNIVNSPAGKYVSINSKGNYAEVPWLEWLLVGGSSPVIIGYQVFYDDYSEKGNNPSRTQHAIMVKGERFSVDSRFAGTKNNNFITRAAEDMNEEISDLIDKYFISKI